MPHFSPSASFSRPFRHAVVATTRPGHEPPTAAPLRARRNPRIPSAGTSDSSGWLSRFVEARSSSVFGLTDSTPTGIISVLLRRKSLPVRRIAAIISAKNAENSGVHPRTRAIGPSSAGIRRACGPLAAVRHRQGRLIGQDGSAGLPAPRGGRPAHPDPGRAQIERDRGGDPRPRAGALVARAPAGHGYRGARRRPTGMSKASSR